MKLRLIDKVAQKQLLLLKHDIIRDKLRGDEILYFLHGFVTHFSKAYTESDVAAIYRTTYSSMLRRRTKGEVARTSLTHIKGNPTHYPTIYWMMKFSDMLLEEIKWDGDVAALRSIGYANAFAHRIYRIKLETDIKSDWFYNPSYALDFNRAWTPEALMAVMYRYVSDCEGSRHNGWVKHIATMKSLFSGGDIYNTGNSEDQGIHGYLYTRKVMTNLYETLIQKPLKVSRHYTNVKQLEEAIKLVDAKIDSQPFIQPHWEIERLASDDLSVYQVVNVVRRIFTLSLHAIDGVKDSLDLAFIRLAEGDWDYQRYVEHMYSSRDVGNTLYALRRIHEYLIDNELSTGKIPEAISSLVAVRKTLETNEASLLR